jgi:hypothetical protein
MLDAEKHRTSSAPPRLHTAADLGLRNEGESAPVNRLSKGSRRPKVRIGISPDPALLDWVDQMTGPGKRFATRTHAFEAGIACLVERLGSESK